MFSPTHRPIHNNVNTHKRHRHPRTGRDSNSAIPASEGPQTHALERAATEICDVYINLKYLVKGMRQVIGLRTRGTGYDLQHKMSCTQLPSFHKSNSVHGLEVFFRSQQFQLFKTFLQVIKPEGSITCWQEFATFPYLQPYDSSPRPPKLFKVHFSIILLSMPSSLIRFSHQTTGCISLLPDACHMHH